MPTSTHGVLTLVSLFKCCCLHFCGNKCGLMLAQGYFKGQRSIQNHKMLLYASLCNQYAIFKCPFLDVPTSTHGVIPSFSLSKCCYLRICRRLAQYSILFTEITSDVVNVYFTHFRGVNYKNGNNVSLCFFITVVTTTQASQIM